MTTGGRVAADPTADQSSVELVVTDLDGTFWSHREEVHPTTIAAWHELHDRGIPVLVATGRRVSSAKKSLARSGLAPPAVLLNGALLVDLATGVRSQPKVCDPDLGATILAAFRAGGLEPGVFVEHAEVEIYLGTDPAVHPHYLERLRSVIATADLDEIVASMPVFMLGAMGLPRESLVEIARSLDGIAQAYVVTDGVGHSLLAGPLGLSKWDGVLEYCEQRGIDGSRILAIGDGPNDVELLTGAAVAVTLADGCPEARAVAHHVVAATSDGGWAEILDLV